MYFFKVYQSFLLPYLLVWYMMLMEYMENCMIVRYNVLLFSLFVFYSCWLDPNKRGAVWAFVGPMIGFILVCFANEWIHNFQLYYVWDRLTSFFWFCHWELWFIIIPEPWKTKEKRKLVMLSLSEYSMLSFTTKYTMSLEKPFWELWRWFLSLE